MYDAALEILPSQTIYRINKAGVPSQLKGSGLWLVFDLFRIADS